MAFSCSCDAFYIFIFEVCVFVRVCANGIYGADIEKRKLYHWCRIYSDLEAGDIIIFRHDGKLLVKRIAAVEGETVERIGAIMTVPEDCYYVLGDNVDNSYDSRYWINPFIRKRDIVARLLIY